MLRFSEASSVLRSREASRHAQVAKPASWNSDSAME